MNTAMMVAMIAGAAGAYAPVNGLKLYYEIHGEGPPVVLLHGGGSTHDTSFSKLIPTLTKNHRVIAFDQQGHGRTADVDRPFSFEQSADDTSALLTYLKVERADVIGFSNGGSIALQLAMRHPAQVRKVVVVSGMSKRDGMTPAFWEGLQHATLDGMPKELRDEYLRVAPHPEALQSFFEKSMQRMLQFKDWRAEDVHAIAAPGLVMVGDADVVRPEHAVELFRLLPHGALAVLPGVDHATMTNWSAGQPSMIETFLSAPMPKETR